jgi:hypothetical protein
MLLPVLLIAVVAVTAAIGTSERHGPSRSAVLLLGLQAVVAGTFLVLAAVRYPNASTGALVALAIMGAGGVAAVACQSALFRMARDRAGWTTLVELM